MGTPGRRSVACSPEGGLVPHGGLSAQESALHGQGLAQVASEQGGKEM